MAEKLEKNPRMLAARHNLALLVARIAARSSEALALWRENINRAPTISRRGSASPRRWRGKASRSRPRSSIARCSAGNRITSRRAIALADLLARRTSYAEAAVEIREAVRAQPQNPNLHERLGDLEKTQGNAAAAAREYGEALRLSTDSAAKKRVKRKMGSYTLSFRQ